MIVEVFSFIFYLFGFVFMLNEIVALSQPIVYTFKINEIKYLFENKDENGKPLLIELDSTGELKHKKKILFYFFTFIYLLWTIVGLFSSQGVLFSFILALSTFKGLIKLFLKLKNEFILTFVDSLFTLIILMFIYLNKYVIQVDASINFSSYFSF